MELSSSRPSERPPFSSRGRNSPPHTFWHQAPLPRGRQHGAGWAVHGEGGRAEGRAPWSPRPLKPLTLTQAQRARTCAPSRMVVNSCSSDCDWRLMVASTAGRKDTGDSDHPSPGGLNAPDVLSSPASRLTLTPSPTADQEFSSSVARRLGWFILEIPPLSWRTCPPHRDLGLIPSDISVPEQRASRITFSIARGSEHSLSGFSLNK